MDKDTLKQMVSDIVQEVFDLPKQFGRSSTHTQWFRFGLG